MMNDLRNYLQNANADIFEIINWAITVAAFHHPIEFLIKRDEIAQTLYSCDESTDCFECHDCQKRTDSVDPSDNERIERGVVDHEVLRIKEIIEKSGENIKSESSSVVKIEKVENSPKVQVIDDEESITVKCECGSNFMTPNSIEEKIEESITVKCECGSNFMTPNSIEEKIEETESKIKIEWKKVETDSKALVIPGEQSEAVKSELLSVVEENIEEVESKIKVKIEKIENSSKVEVTDESKTDKCESGSNFMTPGSINIVVFKSNIGKKCEEPTSMIKIKPENIANGAKVQVVPNKLSKREATKSKIKIKVEETKNTPKARVIPDEESKASSRMEEKFEATKRKLQKGYSENMNKKRRIQMMHSDEVTEQGLPPDRGLYCRLGNVGTQPKIPGFIDTEHVGKKMHRTEYGWNQTEHGWQRYKFSGYMIK